jgi:hypothetical protein
MQNNNSTKEESCNQNNNPLGYKCPLCGEVATQKERTNDFLCLNPNCELSYFSLWTRKPINGNMGYYHKEERPKTLKERFHL